MLADFLPISTRIACVLPPEAIAARGRHRPRADERFPWSFARVFPSLRTLRRKKQARKGFDTGELSSWLFGSRRGQNMQQHSARCDAIRTSPSPI
jgi:hypothetical protein